MEKDDAALNKTNFDICELLSRVLLHRTGDLEAKKMDVECDFAPEPCMVNADESRIEQVAVNLLDNAIKFTPDGGVIRMSVRVNQGICTVIVQDNGVAFRRKTARTSLSASTRRIRRTRPAKARGWD